MSRTGKTIRRVPNSAFTLIELAIVASLIVVLVAISNPLFRKTFRALELKDAAYSISKVMRYAAASAVMEEKTYKMVFDFEKKAYWLVKESVKAPGGFEKAEGRFGNRFYMPRDASLSGDKNELIFLPNGRSTRATVTVMDKGKKKGFDVNATGKAGQVEIIDVSEKQDR